MLKDNINDDRLVLHFDGSKLVSNNSMYIPTSGKKKKGNSRRSAYFRKSQQLSDFQSDFDSQIISEDFEELLSKFKEDHLETPESCIKLTFLLGIPKDDLYYKRPSSDDYIRPNDVTNYIKCTEDSLGSYLKDDKYNFHVELVKYLTNSDSWRFTLIIEPVDDYKIYNEEYVKTKFKI